MGSKEYSEMVSRNIGIIDESQQEILRNSTVALFGVGGLGGVIGEILVRSGVGSIKLVDHDKFEPSNLNRQIFSFRDTLGRWKVDVGEEFLKRINPEVRVEKFREVTTDNVSRILGHAKVTVLAIDKSQGVLTASRASRELGIPLVEGWAIPFANVRVFTKETCTLEEAYGLPTQGREVASISEAEFKEADFLMLKTLRKIEGVESYYPPLAMERIMAGEIVSFAPIVWLTAVMMSLEAIKVILNWGTLSLAPKFSLFDPFQHKMPRLMD